MDQSQKNLERIRAYDADEGEWRTINGAHVLIKNGRIAGGAGGALNGQRFQGHSVGRMAAGSKGQTMASAVNKAYKRQEEAGKNYQNRIMESEAKYNNILNQLQNDYSKSRSREERKPIEKKMDANERNRNSSFRGLERRFNNVVNQTTGLLDRQGRANKAAAKLRETRPELFKQGRAQVPTQSTPSQSKLGRMQPGSTAVNANKETKRLGNNARVYKRTARLQREKKKASTGAKIQELQRKMDLAQQAYNEAPPLQKYKYEGQVTALNNQYRQLKSDLAGYYAQSIAKEDDRNQDAANAKSHLAKMQKLAKALKQSRPDLFKSGNRSGSSPAPAKQHKVGRLPQGKSGYNLSAKYNKANEEGLSAIRKGEREIDQRHKEMMTALRSPYAEFGPHDPSVYRDFVINNFKDYANEKRRKMAEAEKPAMKLAMRLSPAEERIRKLKSRRPDLFKRK